MDSTTPPPLPRETRDTLLVLGVVALVLLPQVAYLPPWASALAALLLGWRMWLASPTAHREAETAKAHRG